MENSIYIAPNIRTQKLEEAETFIQQKRVQRLLMAQSHSITVKEKATKLHGKAVARFEKHVVLFDNAMSKLVDDIEKMQARLKVMNDTHSELQNIEGVLNDIPI
jgi:hypothetical protein